MVIDSVRRTRYGDVLLEFGAKSKNEEYFSSLKNILAEKAKVRSLEPKETSEIRDFDSFRTEKEVQHTIRSDLNGLEGDLMVSVTEENSKVQKQAIVQTNARGAYELLKASRIKIGRVRQRVMVSRATSAGNRGITRRISLLLNAVCSAEKAA